MSLQPPTLKSTLTGASPDFRNRSSDVSDYSSDEEYAPMSFVSQEKPNYTRCMRITSIGIGIFSFAIGVCATSSKIINFHSINDSFSLSTLVTIAAAAAFQSSFQLVLNPKYTSIEKSFIADYSLPTFLIATETYDNLPDIPELKNGFLTFFTALYGVSLSAFIHNVIVQDWMQELNETTPHFLQKVKGLPGSSSSWRKISISGSASKIDSSLDSPLLQGKQSKKNGTPLDKETSFSFGSIASISLFKDKKLNYSPLLSAKGRYLWSSAKFLLGASGIAGGIVWPQGKLAVDFGIILVANSVFQLLHEGAFLQLNKYYEKNLSTSATGMKAYQVFSKFILTSGYVLPGIFIAAAGATRTFKELSAASIILYSLTGAFDGMRRNIEQIRFTTSYTYTLSELRNIDQDQNQFQKTLGYFKWFIGGVVLTSFVGLTIAGLNPQTGTFTPPPAIVPIVLGSFLVSTYAGYGIAEFARRKFSIEKPDQSLINTLYFYLHYSPTAPLLPLYLITKIKIGDEALNNTTLYHNILATAAWALLGFGVGIESNNRGVFKHPRSMSVIGATLMTYFIFQRIFGEIPN